MAYTNYDYYSNTYKGFRISSEKFDFYSDRASEIMDSNTNADINNALVEYSTEIQKCNCAIADILYDEDNNKTLSSEKTLTYSVGYDTSKVKSSNSRIYSIMTMYLTKTGLLYGGI